MNLDVRQDRTLIRATHRSERFVVVELVAPPAPREHRRPPANLAFVIDRSGSMSGGKLRLAKEAVRDAIGRLGADDRFSIVTYDDHIDVVMPGTLATPEARHEAMRRLDPIEARGTTNLGEGWLRGSEQVALGQVVEGVNRVLLLTDGLANVGMTEPDELARHAAELRARGISTTTFGVGDDFNEVLLAGMADAGGGHFRFIASAAEIGRHITEEVGELVEVVARDAVIEVVGRMGCTSSLSPYPTESRGERTFVASGDLVSGSTSVVLRVRCRMAGGPRAGGSSPSPARTARSWVEPGRLVWRASNATNDAQPRDVPVDRIVARLFADRTKQEAIALNRDGRYEEARGRLLATARRIGRYAGRDPELRSIVRELEEQAEYWTVVREESSRKMAYASASYLMRSRAPSGAMRAPDRASRPRAWAGGPG
jgi:Ca-activated chloride channel family protein